MTVIAATSATPDHQCPAGARGALRVAHRVLAGDRTGHAGGGGDRGAEHGADRAGDQRTEHEHADECGERPDTDPLDARRR